MEGLGMVEIERRISEDRVGDVVRMAELVGQQQNRLKWMLGIGLVKDIRFVCHNQLMRKQLLQTSEYNIIQNKLAKSPFAQSFSRLAALNAISLPQSIIQIKNLSHMANKLPLLCILLAIAVMAQAQWTTLSPTDWPRLANDVYFKAGLNLCKAKITGNGKTFKEIYVIRTGPGIEYTLNDTENNVYLCSCVRIAAPVYMNMTFYAYFPGGQRKLEESSDVGVGAVGQLEDNLDFEITPGTGGGDEDVDVLLDGLEEQSGAGGESASVYSMGGLGSGNSLDSAEAALAGSGQAGAVSGNLKTEP